MNEFEVIIVETITKRIKVAFENDGGPEEHDALAEWARCDVEEGRGGELIDEQRTVKAESITWLNEPTRADRQRARELAEKAD